jgi:hypothetical protein
MDSTDASLKKMNYIKTKIDPILSQMVVDILTKQPDEPVEFMIKWLTERKEFFKKNRDTKTIGKDDRSKQSAEETRK